MIDKSSHKSAGELSPFDSWPSGRRWNVQSCNSVTLSLGRLTGPDFG